MPVDRRLNCAAEICCAPDGLSAVNSPALAAAAAILVDAGVPEDLAPKVAAKLRAMGVAFTSTALTDAIRAIAFGT